MIFLSLKNWHILRQLINFIASNTSTANGLTALEHIEMCKYFIWAINFVLPTKDAECLVGLSVGVNSCCIWCLCCSCKYFPLSRLGCAQVWRKKTVYRTNNFVNRAGILICYLAFQYEAHSLEKYFKTHYGHLTKEQKHCCHNVWTATKVWKTLQRIQPAQFSTHWRYCLACGVFSVELLDVYGTVYLVL